MPYRKNQKDFIFPNQHQFDDQNITSKLQQENNQINDFKLPKITLPQSRGKMESRKSNKVPKHLPQLSSQEAESNQNAYEQTQNSSNSFNKKKTQQQQLEESLLPQYQQQQTFTPKMNQQPPNNFAMEVQQQLKNVLSNKHILEMQTSNNNQNEQPHYSEEEFDFEQKINQNKQIIKMRRQENQREKQQKLQIQSNKVIPQFQHNVKFNLNNHTQNTQHQIQARVKPRTKTLKPSTKNETLLQKKMKDYNNSLENKFLQRKKQSIGIVSKNQKSLPRAKSKKVVNVNDLLLHDNNSYGNNISISNNQSNKNTYQLQVKNKLSQKDKKNKLSANSNKKISTQEESDFQKKTQKNSSLFDNIHNFLQNPKRVEKHQKMLKELNKKIQEKDVNKLQQKIKQLNQKLGLSQNNQTKSSYGKTQNQNAFITSQNNLQKTVRDWKRFQIKDKTNLQCQSSNFDKQIDYINYLQQRNTHSLSKFIDHQKLIVQLQLQKKITKSIDKQERQTQK